MAGDFGIELNVGVLGNESKWLLRERDAWMRSCVDLACWGYLRKILWLLMLHLLNRIR